MLVEIYGSGCPNCIRAYDNMKKAAEDTGADAEILKIEDINKIVSKGVMMTPAVAVNGVIKISGKVPSVEEAKKLLGE